MSCNIEEWNYLALSGGLGRIGEIEFYNCY